MSAGIWQANDRVTAQPILVDGPYKTLAAADASAASLTIAESAQRGGRYVVSARLTSREGAQVGLVAKCLNGISSHTK